MNARSSKPISPSWSDRALLAGMLPVVTDEIQRLKTIGF